MIALGFVMFFVCMTLSLLFAGLAALAALQGERARAGVLLGFSFLMAWYVYLLGPYL